MCGLSNKPSDKNRESCSTLSLGFSAGLPDFYQLHLNYKMSSSILTFKFSPALPYTIQVEYERMILARQDDVNIENPVLDVHFTGKYGPQLGLQWSYFPWASSFYIFGGINFRAIKLSGGFQSPLIISTASSSIETNTSIALSAEATIVQHRARFGLGWLIPIFPSYFSMISFGWDVPIGGEASVDMTADLVNPQSTSQVTNETLEEAERTFETDLESQSISDVKSVRDTRLPVIQLSLHYTL